MNTIELVTLALALSMDAFAVSVAAGTTSWITGPRAVFRLAFHFGFFQFIMPVLGWVAGRLLAPFIAPVDHWVAFFILVVIGVRMLRSTGGPSDASDGPDPSRGLLLVVLALATSIDALAVGLSLAVLRVDIWTPCVVIGIITASVSLAGIFLGAKLKRGFGRKAEVAGGLILIIVAIKIVLSHELA
jgi:putative Mn2+ efflux pump MntP